MTAIKRHTVKAGGKRGGTRGGKRGGKRGGTRGGKRGGTRGGKRGGTRGGKRGGTRGGGTVKRGGRLGVPALLFLSQKALQRSLGRKNTVLGKLSKRINKLI